MNYLETSRRQILKSIGSGFGFLAFASLAQDAFARTKTGDPLAAKSPHFSPSAKRVILLTMNGGPSHVDLFDHKPLLADKVGRTTAESVIAGNAGLMPSPFAFKQHGESGLWFSELQPCLAQHADDLCMIHSMHTDLPNHSQAYIQMHTGSFQFKRPSLGAWLLYGLGTENSSLPGFITLSPPSDNGGSQNYGSAFLPAAYQATKIGTSQIPAFYAKLMGIEREPGSALKNMDAFATRQEQRRQLDLLKKLNENKLALDQYNPEIEGAIESFELAFRMQDEIPDLLDISGETQATLDSYGIGAGLETDRFGQQCLLARRMVESGVRFVEVTAPKNWDHHFMLQSALPETCLATDQPVAALLADLKSRSMLKDTLVIWAGEFGRTPYAQSGTGRDHNNKGYTIWMAGGGVRGGMAYGATDELGYAAVENPVHVHDWHATILHLLGLDHKKLTFNYAGRDFRLTDVYGEVVKDIIA